MAQVGAVCKIFIVLDGSDLQYRERIAL